MKIWIDPYGRRRGSIGYRTDAPVPCEVDEANEGVTYIRYGSVDVCPILRVRDANGTTTIDWAYAAWSNRANVAEWTAPDCDIEIETY